MIRMRGNLYERCSICNKNLAVIFTTKTEGGKVKLKEFALIVQKMGLPVVDQLVQQLK